MNRRLIAASALALSFALAGLPVTVRAQQATSSPAAVITQSAPVTLKLTVVISRYQKDQKTGSLPFVLMVIPADVSDKGGSTATLQMGAEVPVPEGSTPGAYRYRSVGTAITSNARQLEGGAYSISLTVSDSQVMSDAQGQNTRGPAFQSFTSTSRVMLRDGGSIQYTAASDKASGETARIDVTMNVVK
jgi:hypothetical protein